MTLAAAGHHPDTCSCHGGAGDWYLAYAPALRRYLLARTRDEQAAEECTNETFLRAIVSRGTFRCTGEGVQPWLYTIARNIAHDYHRSAWRRRETPVAVHLDQQDEAPTPEQAWERRIAAQELARYADRLPADQRHCVRLRFINGLSVDQTASLMRRRQVAVRALQYRALRNLARMVPRAALLAGKGST